MRRLALLVFLVLTVRLDAVTLIAGANGNFTAAATWQLVDATSYLDSEAATVVVGASNIDSAAFTPGAITVDGVAVKVSSRSGAPGVNTFTVILRNSTAGADVASVTINVSDINNVTPGGWYFVKFSVPQLLLVANNYIVRVVASAASMVTLYRNATANNVSRLLRTTTTQAPAAGDQLHVLGEWTAAATVTARTVTMNENAATSYGPTVSGGPPQGATVGKSGALDWVTGATTKLVLKGILYVYSGGTLNIGTVGTPIGGAFVAEYVMASVANVDSGLVVDGTLNIYGATKTTLQTTLTANAAAGTSSLTVGSTTGWLAGDSLGIASTTRTFSECENKIIQSVDSPTTVTLTTNLAAAHSGTAPTRAEVINLTRNVTLHGASALLQGYVLLTQYGIVNIRNGEFYWIGSNTASKRGIDVQTIPASGGAVAVQYSSLRDFSVAGSIGLITTGASWGGLTFSNNVAYNLYRQTINLAATSSTAWTVSNNISMLQTEGDVNGIYELNDLGGVFTNNTAVGARGYAAIHLNSADLVGTFSGNTVHSSYGRGFRVQAAPAPGSVLSSMTTWRNNNEGMWVTASLTRITFNGITAFGNTGSNVQIQVTLLNCTWNNVVSNGDSTFATTTGLGFNGSAELGYNFRLLNSSFSQAAGILTAHTNDIHLNTAAFNAGQTQIWANNTAFGGTNVIAAMTLATTSPISFLHAQRNAVADHRSYYPHGTSRTQTVIFRTATPSEELIPSSASIKMESGPKQAAVAVGNTVTWSVWVYKSVGYAGTQPRLVIRANPSIGLNADTVLDTMAGGAGAWEELTGVTPAAAGDDGVFEAFVDCDTSGSIYVDDWSANGTLISENRGWWQGTPMIVAGGQPIGGNAYWWDASPAVGFPPAGPAPSGATPIINNPILISRRGTYPR